MRPDFDYGAGKKKSAYQRSYGRRIEDIWTQLVGAHLALRNALDRSGALRANARAPVQPLPYKPLRYWRGEALCKLLLRQPVFF